MKTKQKYIVTSALTYANGYTHLGHIAGSLLPADIYVRYRRLNGDDIIYVCGSDEYGTAIEMSAIKEGVSPTEIINKYHEANKKSYADLGISFDIYSRTSNPSHTETAREFFKVLYDKGILYEKTDQQLFSEKENRFLADRFIEGTCPVCGYEEARGDQCENCGSSLSPLQLINPKSKISGDTPVIKDSKQLYFPLSKYQDDLNQWLSAKKNWKPNVINYCKGWFKTGLQDRAVTRDLDWGIKVPIDKYKDKVIYVWIEAPVGYISATKDLFTERGEPDKWKEYWQQPDTKLIHFLGKDNVIFHAIIFPAMLMAHGDYVLVDNIPANEFLNMGGEKFSKSKGIGSVVKDVLKVYEPDIIRYAIASNMPENKDTEFNWEDVVNKNNNELAAILGNFVNRVVVFTKSKFDNVVPAKHHETQNEIFDEIKKAADLISSHFEKFRFKDALTETMNCARMANKYFNDNEPWNLIKNNQDKCAGVLNNCIQIIHSLGILFSPFIPFTSDKILNVLNKDMSVFTWDKIGEEVLKSGHRLGENHILFPQLELPKQTESAEQNQLITIDEFSKVKLKTAKVLSCEAVPKSKKLYKLKLKSGNIEKQIVSGIAEHYSPEDLIGKIVVIVDNLKSAKLMGIESQGMLLAAKNGSSLKIITVDGGMTDGANVS
ncbi:MAG: methionine--tRNA ligase [Ignavibacteriales bacterium UTCHB1]|jgi:methionyl-tRNA synthetase/methionyl-tRNA synthetase C-terminal region/beta chain|nr:methionine--tRNA ligase [Ignavibacteria bacterium]OQY76894.1 MAG: methionine--tRNA ligase [Ignavibacteriales bacterium UTCHB1]